METINLKNDFKLSFEKLTNKIRLIITKNNEDWVCRKETLNSLCSFAEEDVTHIFKGRLRLNKLRDIIEVRVKNELIGTVTNEDFTQALIKIK